MISALPAIWLYSCLAQSAGAASVTLMTGFPPSGQGAFIQVANAAFNTCSVWAKVMSFDASFCTEKPTHELGQKSVTPQSPAPAGVHTCAVPTLGQLLVRQKARASA